ELRGCEITHKLIKSKLASEMDWETEYEANILSIKVVSCIAEAIEHINFYGSGHSDAIIADDYNAIELFMNEIDSACIYANASTRFTDGVEFGFGAEIGISTNKLHARGPMGLNELTTYKYKIYGHGETR
ncbi:MAG: gamma-glutamyl-phosphate reductase, partial [Sulfurimonas sp.]